MPEQRRVRIDERGLPVSKEDAAEKPVKPVAEGECDCPHLDREDWDGVESDWSDITFVRSTTTAVMGIPLGYDSTREELRRKAEQLGASIPEDAMLLNGSGKFRRPVMLEVEGASDSKQIERPGGIAFTRIFEAPWGQLQKVAKRTEEEAQKKYGRKPDAMWVWYLTCRVCSRARNFETLFAAHYKTRP